MIGLWNVNWLNQNSQRAYPLTDAGDKRCAFSPDLKIPDDFLLAVRLSISTGHNVRVDRFFLKSVAVSGAGCTLTFGYADGSANPSVAVASITASEGIANCRLTGLGDFSDTTGYAAVNGASSLLKEWTGFYTFNPESAYLEPDCIIPMLRGVSAITVNNGSSVSQRYYGDIEIAAGANMSITTEATATGACITLSAISSEGFEEDCACELHEDAPCVRSIGGAYPDANGNITFEGVDCVSVTASGNTLTFQDTCAEPDCGCNELESLGATIREMEDGVATLNNQLEALYALIVQTNAELTASIKCDGGCAGTATGITVPSTLTPIPLTIHTGIVTDD